MQQIHMHELTLLEIGPDGVAETRRIQIRPGQRLTFGRTSKADHTFPFDELMSRVHFCIEGREDGTTVRDLRSKNGTLLNHQRVHFGRVADGDLIIAGTTLFRFSIRPSGAHQDTRKKADLKLDPGSRLARPADEETRRQHYFD